MQLSASALRRELSFRSLKIARRHAHELSFGRVPSVVFHDEDGIHGNFHPSSYKAILETPQWSRRLRKSYTAGKWIPRRWDRVRAELDCANSSDALLMNIFCYPKVMQNARLCGLLGIALGLEPAFGFKPRIPFANELTDQTEVDMSLGHLLVEAKLTEGGFQTAPIDRVSRYRHIHEVFDLEELPRKESAVHSYQLIRGVLAAYSLGRSFMVLCDARRGDLIERWFHVIRAVRLYDLRSQLALVTWQELAVTLPGSLQGFLEDKYGIVGV